jgi:hypothetical protein
MNIPMDRQQFARELLGPGAAQPRELPMAPQAPAEGGETPPNYTEQAPQPEQSCATCEYFSGATQGCSLFNGYPVEADGTCDAWVALQPEVSAAHAGIDPARADAVMAMEGGM